MSPQTVAFIGLGYIGLPTAVTMAKSGLNVIGVDVNQDLVAAINNGETPIVEEGLPEALEETVKNGSFKASLETPAANAYIIAVPTPFAADYKIDLKYIYSAAESLAKVLKGDELIVLESTSSPGTTRKMADRILELRPDLAEDGTANEEGKPVLYFAHCPERILPGLAMEELITNDRIIGGMTPEATRRAKEIYASFCTAELLETDDVTAEMAKLTENSFRDVNIAFANELSIICDDLGVNVWELIELANHHPRVNILQPGPGVGGHCIAVDPWFIVSSAPSLSRLIKTAREVNNSKPEWVVNKVAATLEENENAKIAVLGLAFKPDIDDLRESPSLQIAEVIAQRFPENKFLVGEPNINSLPQKLANSSNVTLLDTSEAIAEADVILLLVDHKQFKDITAAQLKGKEIIDTKGIWR